MTSVALRLRNSFQRISSANRLRLALFAVAALASVPIVFSNINSSPLEYDSAYQLQLSSNLVEGHGYASYGSFNDGHNKLFDPYLTTGPTVVLPIALLFKVFGQHVLVARLYMAGVILAFMYVLVYLASLGGGRRKQVVTAGLAVLLFLVTVNHITNYLVPTDPIGEIPAALLIIVSAIAMSRRQYGRSGVALSLAVLTKFLMLMAVPFGVFLVAYLYWKHRITWKPVLRFVAGLAVPQLVWELYKLLSLGSVNAYIANWKAFIYFLRVAGSGIGAPQPGQVHHLFKVLNYGQKAHVFIASYGGPAVLAALALTIIALLAVANGARAWQIGRQYSLIIAFIVFTCAWWLFISDAYNFRHISPVALVLPALLAVFIARIPIHQYWNLALVALLGIVLVSAYLFSAHSNLASPLPYTLHDQQRVALAAQQTHQPLLHRDWWQNPEILFLAHEHSRDVTVHKNLHGTLVLTPVMDDMTPDDYRAGLKQCGHTYLQIKRYIVCQYTSH